MSERIRFRSLDDLNKETENEKKDRIADNFTEFIGYIGEHDLGAIHDMEMSSLLEIVELFGISRFEFKDIDEVNEFENNLVVLAAAMHDWYHSKDEVLRSQWCTPLLKFFRLVGFSDAVIVDEIGEWTRKIEDSDKMLLNNAARTLEPAMPPIHVDISAEDKHGAVVNYGVLTEWVFNNNISAIDAFVSSFGVRSLLQSMENAVGESEDAINFKLSSSLGNRFIKYINARRAYDRMTQYEWQGYLVEFLVAIMLEPEKISDNIAEFYKNELDTSKHVFNEVARDFGIPVPFKDIVVH